MIRSLHGYREVVEAALVASADIVLRNIMASAEDTLLDTGQIDFDVFGSDVNEHDFKTESSCSNHHLQVISAGERGLDREARSPLQVLFGKTQDFPPCSDG